MATCPNGHQTAASDYCDVCGRPLTAAASPVLRPVTPQDCPHCHRRNAADALFCETCGYDFMTGQMPPNDLAELLGIAPRDPRSEQGAETQIVSPADEPTAPISSPLPDANPMESESPTTPGHAPRQPVWLAEVWVDPAWYEAQVTDNPRPPVGLPRLVRLGKDSALIGRPSAGRGIRPDVDCEPDTACSRRQAMLTFDGARWLIEDLESANGTYVGPATGLLPTEPIPRGRVELRPDDRVYVGAWTRIVVRRATPEELATI